MKEDFFFHERQIRIKWICIIKIEIKNFSSHMKKMPHTMQYLIKNTKRNLVDWINLHHQNEKRPSKKSVSSHIFSKKVKNINEKTKNVHVSQIITFHHKLLNFITFNEFHFCYSLLLCSTLTSTWNPPLLEPSFSKRNHKLSKYRVMQEK